MKKLLAMLLACMLLLCTACAGQSIDLNSEAYLPLPWENLSWGTSLEELQTQYPNGTMSTVGEDLFQTTIFIVESSDFAQVMDTDVVSVEFMFKPALSYNGKENGLVLYRVGCKLSGGDYDSLSAGLDKTMGEGTDGFDMNAKQVRVWLAGKGLRELDAATAALAVALDPSPVDSVRPTLFGDAATAATDAAKWPGLNLSDTSACKKVQGLLTKEDSQRRVSLYNYGDSVFLYYQAGGMTYAPLAQTLLGTGK